MKLSRIRVRAGYVAGLIVVVFAAPTEGSLALGGALALAGETIRIWASGHIQKTLALATGGPYAHTRNPLYVGSVIMAAGLLVAAFHPAAVAAGAIYLGVFYPTIIREEAAFLRSKFGDAYDAWAREVPLFLPRLTPGGPRETRFETARLLANHEWRTVIGLLAIAAFLGWRLR